MQQPKSRFSKGGNKNNMMMQPRRRKRIKLPKGHPSDAELYAAYLAANGKVTQCPPGYAMGSLPSTSFGLE